MPRVPPPEIPVITFLSPNKGDQGLIEFWNTENASYTPLDVGAPHPKSREYPNFRLGNQRPVQGDEKWVIRTWVTDETSPDWFNYSLKFSGEDNAYPIFIRTYRELRRTYVPRPKAAALGAIYKLVVEHEGNGYANGAYPTLTFADPVVNPISVAIGHGVVNSEGAITECVLDFGGEGYETDVFFTVEAPISGTQARGIAYVQPTAAILINEQANLYPPESEFYADYLQVVRVYETLPGPTFTTTRIDDDGMVVSISKTRGLCADIVSQEVIVDGLWCKTTKVPTESDIVCEQVQECRQVPGNPMVSVKVDKDGIDRDIIRTLKDTTTIATGEVVGGGGVWITTEKEAVSDLVAWEVVTAREVEPNGTVNPVVSYKIDGDHETVTQTTRLRETSAITPSATEAGGNITTVEAEEVTDLVANQVTTVVKFLDKALYAVSIPESIIPLEFRATIPTVIESHILAGTASMPTLNGSEFSVQEHQLTKLLYERRTESFGDLEFPIEQHGQETSSEYGGAILDVHRTLDDSALTADEGENIVESYVHPIGDNLMWFRETKKRPSTDAAWPIVPSRLWDANMRVMYDEEFQWLATGTSEDAPPGGSFAWLSEVKAKDKWHAQKVNSLKPEPPYTDEASALITYQMKPYDFPGWLAFSGTGYYVRGAHANLILHTIRTWWVKSATTPTAGPTGSGSDIEYDEIITGDVIINNLSNTGLEYARNVLHDGLTIGTLNFPATTPSATQYAFGTVSGTDNQNIASLYSPGSVGGYVVGDTVTINNGTYTMSVDVTFVYDVGAITGLIGGTTIVDPAGNYPPGTYGPIAATGGSGSGAFFNVWSVDVPTYTPGTAWIGQEHVIGADVSLEKEKDIWKIQTESVIMR